MVYIPKSLIEAAQEINRGRSQKVPLRELLRWFDSSHRDVKLLAKIDQALSSLQLGTIPSIWEARIDDEVTIVTSVPAQLIPNVAADFSEKAVLSIDSKSGFPVYRFRDFLAALDTAYNYGFVALLILNDPELRSRELRRLDSEPGRRFGRLVPASYRLVLYGVELRSPGFWSIFGDKSLLEQIRLYLNDRHERRKDREYREPAERQSLAMDNKLKELDFNLKLGNLLEQRIALARQAGASDEEIRVIVQRFIALPLSSLDQYVDQSLIGPARMVEEGPDDNEIPG